MRPPLEELGLTMRVLAIDASLRNTGVAVIDANGDGKLQALYFGVIHNCRFSPDVVLPGRDPRSAG